MSALKLARHVFACPGGLYLYPYGAIFAMTKFRSWILPPQNARARRWSDAQEGRSTFHNGKEVDLSMPNHKEQLGGHDELSTVYLATGSLLAS